MINILVVDDHKLVREGICQLVAGQVDMQVVATADNGQTALDLLSQNLKVDLLLTDLNMPFMSGLELTQRALANYDGLQILVLSMHCSPSTSQKLIAAGARACLAKDDGNELLSSIRLIMQPNQQDFEMHHERYH